MTLTIPKVHLNGTSKQSLMAQYRNAFEAVNVAIATLKEIETHGRDYYVQDKPGERPTIYAAQDEQRARLQKLLDVKKELEEIAWEISKQKERGE